MSIPIQMAGLKSLISHHSESAALGGPAPAMICMPLSRVGMLQQRSVGMLRCSSKFDWKMCKSRNGLVGCCICRRQLQGVKRLIQQLTEALHNSTYILRVSREARFAQLLGIIMVMVRTDEGYLELLVLSSKRRYGNALTHLVLNCFVFQLVYADSSMHIPLEGRKLLLMSNCF
jgi:hypothetical protein